MPETPNRITVGELMEHLKHAEPETELFFGSGDLTFYRTKWRGDNLLQIEFNEVYSLDED